MSSDRLSALDIRVKSGPKVVAVDAEAEAMTVAEVMAGHCLAKLSCSARGCWHWKHLDLYALRDAGHGSVSLGELKPRLKCAGCGAKSPTLSIIDPFRSAIP